MRQKRMEEQEMYYDELETFRSEERDAPMSPWTLFMMQRFPDFYRPDSNDDNEGEYTQDCT